MESSPKTLTYEQAVILLKALKTKTPELATRVARFKALEFVPSTKRYASYIGRLEAYFDLLLNVNVSHDYISQIDEGLAILEGMSNLLSRTSQLSAELKTLSDLLESVWQFRDLRRGDSGKQCTYTRNLINTLNYEIDRLSTNVARLLEDLSNRLEHMADASSNPIYQRGLPVGVCEYLVLWAEFSKRERIALIWQGSHDMPHANVVSSTMIRYFDIRRDKYSMSHEEIKELTEVRDLTASLRSC